MRVHDLDAVVEIERRSFPHPWTPGLFLHELKLPFSTTLVVRPTEGDASILAYICWWTVGDEVHLLNLAVTPEHRRDGIGRSLVELLVQTARENGARSVTLEVHSDNVPGIALYRGFGFVETGLRKNYYARNEHAVLMTLELAGPGPSP